MYENMNFRDIALFLFRYGFITFETQEDAQKILQEVSNIPPYDSLLNNSFHISLFSLLLWICRSVKIGHCVLIPISCGTRERSCHFLVERFTLTYSVYFLVLPLLRKDCFSNAF